MKIRQFMVAISAVTLAGTFATPAAGAGYAVCAFYATLTPKHTDYGDHQGAAWIDVVFFDDDDPIPAQRALQQAFADHIRAGAWNKWNPSHDNETADCKINRNSAPGTGQARSNQKEWRAQFRSAGWTARGSGGIYWWNSRAGHAKELLIQNSDWRGPIRHH